MGNAVSVRNLVDFTGTPLRRFTGVLEGFPTEPATGYDGTRVNLNFTIGEVIQSTEPYELPTAVLNMGLSNKKKSKWGYFGESLAKLLPEGADIDFAVGKTVGMVFCDGQEGRPAPRPIWQRDADRSEYPNGEVPTPVWEVYELEGAAAGGKATGATEQAKILLDGKADSDFNKEAYADSTIRKDVELQRSITDGSFLKAMTDTGEFTKDENGIYHRVAK
jgi:hypothetical protein